MSIKKFISMVTESLGIEKINKSSKRKSIKSLLKKLKAKKDTLSKELAKKTDKAETKDKKEELDIITIQIKKGEKILEKLNS